MLPYPRLADGAAALQGWINRWLFRIRADEPAPIVLVQRRIFVFPTRAGVVLLLTLFTMLIASINYNLSLGYAFTFLIGGAAVASIVHAFRNLLGLSLRPLPAAPVFLGAPAVFRIEISSSRSDARPAVQFTLEDGEPVLAELPEGATEVALQRPTGTRGWLSMGKLTIDTTHPLGFIRAWSVFRPAARVLVYPRPEAHPPPPPPASRDAAPGREHGAFGQDDFAGLRQHQPTDSPRHIAWKVYAREGPLMVKEFDGGDAGELRLSWHALPAALDGEARLSRLCAWVCQAAATGARFSLSLPNKTLPVSAGPAHAAQCLEALALCAVSDDVPRQGRS
jgi:uncharacterized protein (DUF58 family)